MADPDIILPVKQLLCKVPASAGHEDEALAVFLEHARGIAVPADGVIAPAGEVNNCMCLIEAGEVFAARH